jgi:glycosyltransferase involved in cell wall biosynthesis
MATFEGRVGLVQRVVPHYRASFFNALGRACSGGLSVFAGKPRPDEMIKSVDNLEDADLRRGKNLHLFNGSLYLCFQLGLLDWLRDWNPDALIVEANPRYLRTPAALRWMHQRSKPVIGWGLGAPSLSGFLAQLRCKRRQTFIKQFDALITYSQTGAAEYAALGFPKERIYIAVNAVTPPPAHPMPQREPPVKGQKAKVLFVGRLQERKNLDNLIRACAQLLDSLQPELVIVGDGPAQKQLKTLAEEVYPVTTFTGALYGNALAEQFQAADLFVLPGTGGLAVQQAMSYGLPIIVAQADGTQADLLRPENGWQVPANDLPALTAALQDALSDIAHLREMGSESYRIVAEEINLDQMVEVFIQALKESAR